MKSNVNRFMIDPLAKRLLATTFAVLAVCVLGCAKSDVTTKDEHGNTITTSSDGSKTTYVDPRGNTSSVDNKTGSISSTAVDGNKTELGAKVTEAELGLPFYPGSIPAAKADFKASNSKERSVSSNRTTPDSVDKVVDFYKAKLIKPGVEMMGSDSNAMVFMNGHLQNGGRVSMTIIRGAKAKETTISIGVGYKLKP